MLVKVTLVNFLSWKSLSFDFQSGVTLLEAFNYDDNTNEGAGKSAIFNALTWCLYGNMPKDVNIDEVIKTGEKDCKVEVHLSNGSKVVRSRKPNDFYIETAEGKIERGKDAKDTQKLVTSLIGLSFDTFCYAVYFAQNYPKRFITATQEDKVKILSELQDLTIFDSASKKSNDLHKQYVLEGVKLSSERSSKQHTLNMLNENLKSYQDLSDKFESAQAKELDEYITQQQQISASFNRLTEQLNEIVIDGSIPKLQTELQELRSKYAGYMSKIETINELKKQSRETGNCPTCNRPLDSCNETIDIPDDLPAWAEAGKVYVEIERLATKLSSLVEAQRKNDEIKTKLTILKEKERSISANVNRLESQSNQFIDKIIETSSKMRDLEAKLSNLDEAIKVNTGLINDYEYLKTGFKEVKAHVFQSLLSELNRRSNHYLNQLFDFPVSIKFTNVNEYGEIAKIFTKVTLDGVERGLGLLSGGQLRRVQLAVDFALSDIVVQRSHSPINLRILDEQFKDLSEPSMVKIVELLKNMKGTTLVVEHNSLIKAAVNQTVKIEYRNGTSTLTNS